MGSWHPRVICIRRWEAEREPCQINPCDLCAPYVPERTRLRDIRGRWICSGEFRLLIGTFSLMLYPYQSLSPILHRIGHERIILTYISWSDVPGDLATGLIDLRGKEKKIRSRRTGKLERPKRDKSRRKFVRNYDFRWGAKSVSFLRNIEDGKVVIEVLDIIFLSNLKYLAANFFKEFLHLNIYI